jgi:hypothetical protein
VKLDVVKADGLPYRRFARRKWPKFGSFGLQGCDYASGLHIAKSRLAGTMSKLTQQPATTSTLRNSNPASIVKMLIQEVHKDVATKADGKEGSMSRWSPQPLSQHRSF